MVIICYFNFTDISFDAIVHLRTFKIKSYMYADDLLKRSRLLTTTDGGNGI